jgi:2-polyprenyl-6-methoxyphenol hydroxylase-like FAD-dependent oxidoreductase
MDNSDFRNEKDADTPTSILYDIIVIGAGFSGSLFTIKAAEMGLTLKVFDTKDPFPEVFRAEKLETDQHSALENLGLIHLVEPKTFNFIDEVVVFRRGKMKRKPQCKHRGIDYSKTINSFREPLKAQGLLDVNVVTSIAASKIGYAVTAGDNKSYQTRLLVIATGGNNRLLKPLGLEDFDHGELASTTFGFYLKADRPTGFPYDAFNFQPDKNNQGLDFSTFFSIGDRMRVNVFTYWPIKSETARAFKNDTKAQIHHYFPSLKDIIGDFSITSPVQVFTTSYYRKNCSHVDNLAIIGDSYQSVGPATGLGLSKCLTDVTELLALVKVWSSHGKNEFNCQDFYNNKKKQNIDNYAREMWEWSHQRSTSLSFSAKLIHLKNAFRRMTPAKIFSLLKRKWVK